jgi:hypothetical protein
MADVSGADAKFAHLLLKALSVHASSLGSP